MVGQSDHYTTLLIENPEAFRIWRESIVTDALENLENPDQLNPETGGSKEIHSGGRSMVALRWCSPPSSRNRIDIGG